MDDLLQINVPSTPMRSTSSKNSDLVSECLFGEIFKVVKKSNDWVYGANQTDNYFGWIKVSKTRKVIKTTHIINVPRTLIYSKPTVKSNIIFHLPMCSLVQIINEDESGLNIWKNPRQRTSIVPVDGGHF